MADLSVSGSGVGNALSQILLCADILPGDQISYEMCKTIYLYHIIGKKMAESPIAMAQFKPRLIKIGTGQQDELRDAFNKQWKTDKCTPNIRNVATQARVYGIASVAVLVEGQDTKKPLELKDLSDKKISINVFDPLNTSGSLVLNQNPNAMDFQKYGDIAVAGVTYHRSRTITMMNESPVYIAYTESAFGFVGRSVYQRGLFPLKSYIQTMLANDMVARKVGLIVAAIQLAGSIMDAVMWASTAFKRNILKIGATDNVISIGQNDRIESLDLTNLDGPLSLVRKNILEDIAASADMPALLLNNETFAEGFGEGSEDAYAIASYIDGIRDWMQPLYEFFDMITQRRAWNERFFKTMQEKYPEEYKSMEYEEAFYQWSNGFSAEWVSVIREPESERVKIADVKLRAALAAFESLSAVLDPENKANALEFLCEQFNSTPELFSSKLEFDIEEFKNYTPPEPEGGEGESESGGGLAKQSFKLGRKDSAITSYLNSPPLEGDIRKRIVALERYVKRIGLVK